ncbi:MAG: TonB-dependent hemoglobin/transferrin/lactoferrin family receptor [Geitlerinemataceae cyanobacterium]
MKTNFLLRTFLASGLLGLAWSTAAIAQTPADAVNATVTSKQQLAKSAEPAIEPTAEPVSEPVSESVADASVPETSEEALALAAPENPESEATGTAADLLSGVVVAGENSEAIADLPADLPAEPETTIAQSGESDGEGGGLRFSVTGTRNPEPVENIPATITVFDEDDFNFYEVQGLQDLLRYEPGVSVDGSLQRYGAQDVNIRGIEGNRVLFQVDNIRLPEQFSFGGLPPGGFRIGRGDYVDFATLQAVEVLRGPASTLFGSDALGGVIAFRSIKPSDLLEPGENFGGDASLGYVSASGGVDSVLRVAGRQEEVSAVVVASRRDAREVDNFADDEFSNGINVNDFNLFGNFVVEADENSEFSLIFEDVNRSSEYTIAEGNRSSGSRPSLTQLNVTGENEIERTRVSLSYEFDDEDSDSFLQYARAQLYYQDASTNEDVTEIRAGGSAALSREPVRRVSFNEFIAQSYGADAQFRSDFTTGDVEHRLTYGVDFSETYNSRPRDRTQTGLVSGITTNNFGVSGTFPEKDFADGETVRLGFYVQDEIAIGDFDIIAGLRFDYYDLETSNDRDFNGNAASLDADALSPRLGVVYSITPELAVYGQYARGFRAPLYSEITSGFTNFAFGYETISNPDLDPETSDSFEIGVRGNYSRFNFGVTGFFNTYDDFIAPTQFVGFRPDGIQQFQTINIDGAEIWGIEASAEYRFSDEPYGLSLIGSLAFAEGNNLEEDEPLTSVNPFQAVLGLRYLSPDDVWRAEFIGTFAGEARVPDDSDLFVPDSYAVFDLIGRYRPSSNVELNLGIYNIFDNEYYQYAEVRNVGVIGGDADREQYTQPGINVRFGVNVTF